MLVSSARLMGCPILSLHIGGQMAEVTELIVDPNTLKLVAVRVDGAMVDEETGDLLPMESVREFSSAGMVVNSADDLVSEEDAVRLKEVLKLNFRLVGLKVVTKKKEKLGKVLDFVLDTATWEVYQVVVQRPVLKAFLDPELLISRQSIVEVNDYEMVVKSEHEKVKAKPLARPADFVPDFVNPFRKPDFAAGTEVEE